MIHRAPFGSMERFVAVLLEHCGGNFPLWLTPEQVIILPISEKYNNYAEKVLKLLKNSDLRAKIDSRNEKAGKKIRDAEMNKIPYMVIVGEREELGNTISVRRHGEGDLGSFEVEKFIMKIEAEVNQMISE
jgi:threonyl-tRNA synthetase